MFGFSGGGEGGAGGESRLDGEGGGVGEDEGEVGGKGR